jgi:hypothetical protein
MRHRHWHGWARPLAVLAFCLAAGIGVAAQSGSGTLVGTVADEQGATMPGATVVATEIATGASRTVVTGADGIFSFASLPPGRYRFQITLSGFAPLNLTDVNLAPTEVRDLGRQVLRIGQLNEVVTVSGEAAAVQTATSSRMGTVTADQLTNLTQKGRDIWGMMSVVPGVQDTNMRRDFSTWTAMGTITINGMPATSKVVVMDGVSIVDELGSNAMVNPNIDAVGEVQVISSGFTAENGRSNGGLVVMTTKSGTNRFSGSAWYNARRAEWNANEYFREKGNLPKPLYHVNIPGYSIGGPIWIPKVLNKGTLFFFASQEFTDDLRESQLVYNNMPTALERMGDFSQTYFGNANGPGEGTLQVITDPLTGQPFPGNVIPQGRINPLGSAMVNLLMMPNGIRNPANNQYHAANNMVETLPRHSRTNNTFRLDVVLGERLRGSWRYIRDREDNISNNAFSPGIGFTNNAVPGKISTGSITAVLSPSMVNESTFGYAWNSYSWIAPTGEFAEDYRKYYRSAVGIDPPKLYPFGAYRDPQGKGYEYDQADQYPYLPTMSYGGGNRAGLASFNPASAANRILPAGNRNLRWSFANNLSWTRGTHNFKFGLSTEWASKTEPLSPNYRGNYNFGHNAQNPLNTGNGYANALLGYFNTYTELTNRVDRDRRHWHTEWFAQDSWRMKTNFTLDYGVRFTYTGAYYDTRQSTAGFYEPGWEASKAPRLYQPICANGNPGNMACPASQQRAHDPANPGTLLPSVYVGNLVPGSGDLTNGMVADSYPGRRGGEYFDFTPFVAAPRVGFAWDIKGDGRQALRASTGIFYAIPTRGQWEGFVGAPPSAFNRVVQWGSFADIQNFATSGLSFVETPFTAQYAGGETRSLDKSYNLNVAYQREVGFNTTAEVAYVGSWTYAGGRTEDINRPVNSVFMLANPNNLFNNNAKADNLLRTTYPGMGAINKWFDAADGNNVNANTLLYHSMQTSVQRRMTRGLAMGMAYTLAKGWGWNGYNPVLLEADPSGELNRLFNWGPTPDNRVHNLNINYSYNIPTATNAAVVRWLVSDWQVSGVTRFMSGQATQPACSTTTSGIANTNPTLTPGVTARCVYTGEPLYLDSQDMSLPRDERLHFNPAAFAMATPFSATEGNFGNVPNGILRHPSFWNWDLTLARRFPIPQLGPNAGARVQLQWFNIFNTAQFTNLNTTMQFADDPNVPGVDSLRLNSTDTGRFTGGINPPRQFGLTMRLDF